MKPRNQMILVFFLLAALCMTCRAQSKDPSQFDIDGVKLGMSVDEAKAALKAHGFTYIAIAQQGSRLGKGPFIGAVIGMSGKEYCTKADAAKYGPNTTACGGEHDLGDHVAVLFTETDLKVYSINRRMQFDRNTPIPVDTLTKDVIEKYGDPPPLGISYGPSMGTMFWTYDLQGRLISAQRGLSDNPMWNECALEAPDRSFSPNGQDNVHFFHDNQGNYGDGYHINAPLPYQSAMETPLAWRNAVSVYNPIVRTLLRSNFSVRCGVSLKIGYGWSGNPALQQSKPRTLVEAFGVSLVDNQLAIKNLKNLIDYANGIQAKQLDDLHKKAEGQKPF
jgi:hypothetical protein